jgi:DoxX-like family
MSITLWIMQILLAAMFAFAGGRKLVSEEAKKHLGRTLAIFIGAAEVAGAIGLIAPLATGILPQLTAVAAVSLAAVMVLAAGYHLRRGDGARQTTPALVLLLLTAFVAYGRW